MRARVTSENALSRVCLIPRHPLVVRFMRTLVRRLLKISLKVLSAIPSNSEKQSARSTIFLLDGGTENVTLRADLRALRVAVKDPIVVALGKPLSIDELCRLVALGIRGYLPDNRVEADFARAISRVHSGHCWLPPGTLEEFAIHAARLSAIKPHASRPFTQRERAVLELVGRGLSNKEIASALGISERTAKFHLGNVFTKLEVHDRNSALRVAAGNN